MGKKTTGELCARLKEISDRLERGPQEELRSTNEKTEAPIDSLAVPPLQAANESTGNSEDNQTAELEALISAEIAGLEEERSPLPNQEAEESGRRMAKDFPAAASNMMLSASLNNF